MKEKTADEMFEELGYTNVRQNEYWIVYKGKEKDIDFSLRYKTIVLENEKKSKKLTMQELQAIYKKCEELKWIK